MKNRFFVFKFLKEVAILSLTMFFRPSPGVSFEKKNSPSDMIQMFFKNLKSGPKNFKPNKNFWI